MKPWWPQHRRAVLRALVLAMLSLTGRTALAEPAASLGLTGDEARWLQAHPVIRVGMDPDYPPYEWIDPKGQRVGLTVDLLQLLERPLGVRFEVVPAANWPAVLALARRGELEVLTSVVETPDRAAYLIFAGQYRELQTVIIDDGRGGFLGTLKALDGKRVSLERGYYTQEVLARDHPRITLVPTESTREALELVASGQADAYVGDATPASFAMQRYGLSTLRFSGQTEYSTPQRFGITRGNPELASILEKALASIPPADSEAIFTRWMSMRVERGVQPRTLVSVGALVAALALVAGLWLQRLRREVRSRKQAEERERARSTTLELLADGRALEQVLQSITAAVERDNPRVLATLVAGLAAPPNLPGQWSTSLRGSSNEVIGALTLAPRGARERIQFDPGLVEQSVRLASVAVQTVTAAEKQRSNEALYRLLTEDAQDVAWRTDAALRITYISPVDEHVRGFRADEVVGHHVFEMFDEDGILEVKRLLGQRAAALGDSGFVAFEVQHRCKDGRKLWAEVHSKPERDTSGAIVGYHGITRETTLRRALEGERALNARLSAVTTLVAGIAHETNNPLAAVIASQSWVADEVAQLREALRASHPVDCAALAGRLDEVSEALSDAAQASQRIARIVNNLSIFGGPERGRTRLQLLPVVERALLVLPDSVSPLQRAALRVEHLDAPDVVASESQLVQLIANLVTNAVQACEGAPGLVTVRLGRGGPGLARLQVRDRGVGISPEVLERMYDPFFTTRPVGQGVGLGLPVARSIVLAHGGQLSCVSAPGVGTTFTVDLPGAP